MYDKYILKVMNQFVFVLPLVLMSSLPKICFLRSFSLVWWPTIFFVKHLKIEIYYSHIVKKYGYYFQVNSTLAACGSNQNTLVICLTISHLVCHFHMLISFQIFDEHAYLMNVQWLLKPFVQSCISEC